MESRHRGSLILSYSVSRALLFFFYGGVIKPYRVKDIATQVVGQNPNAVPSPEHDRGSGNLPCGLGCATGSPRIFGRHSRSQVAQITRNPGEHLTIQISEWDLTPSAGGWGEPRNLYFDNILQEVLRACNKWFGNPNHSFLPCRILIAGVTSQICEKNSRGCRGKLGKLGRL